MIEKMIVQQKKKHLFEKETFICERVYAVGEKSIEYRYFLAKNLKTETN